MSEKLKVEKREILGKKIKKLRKEGILPANVYGKDMASVAVQLPTLEFNSVFEKAGETGIVELTFDKETIPVLIHNVQSNPISRQPLHVDFLKVNLKEKITANIPLEFVGEPQLVKDGLATFMHPVDEVEVEALPTDLPEKIEVNIDSLAEVGSQITIAELTAPSGVTITSEPSTVVATLAEIKEEEPEPEPEAEEGTEGEAGEATEGEAPSEDGKPEGEAEAPTEENKE